MLTVTLIYSPSCGACKNLKPAFNQLKYKYASSTRFIETTETSGVDGIYAFPTIIFKVGGSEVGRVVGNNPKEIENIILQHSGSRLIPTIPKRVVFPPLHKNFKGKENYKRMGDMY